MSKPVYIYGLVDPESLAIRYIGKSIRPMQRLQNHMNEVSNCHRSHWLQSLKAKGLRPELVMIESLEGDWPWQEAERFWIAYGRANGWPLTNNTDGGDGVEGLPEETRRRMATTWTGRKHTEESKLRIGAATSMRRHTEETKARMSAAHSGRVITWGDKLSKSLRRLSDEQVQAIKQRLDAGEGTCALASEYGVHRTTISKIKMGTYYEKCRAVKAGPMFASAEAA